MTEETIESSEQGAPAETSATPEPVVEEAQQDDASSNALSAAEQADAELSEEERAERIRVLKPIIEGAVMAAGEAIKVARLQSLFDENEMPSKAILTEVLQAIQNDCEGRGFQLIEVASGWRFQVREDSAMWVNRLWEEKPQKYSRALLETLALIAYRQPLTRGDIEEVRGVAVSSHIIKTLTEREWVKVVGHRDVPGRPSLYATTKTFLDYFNLKSLDELPTLGELRDIESLNASLDLQDQLSPEMLAEMKAQDGAEANETEQAQPKTGVEVEVEQVAETEQAPTDAGAAEASDPEAQALANDSDEVTTSSEASDIAGSEEESTEIDVDDEDDETHVH